MKKQILIDTDCGMDDIIAITMILSSNKFNIKGITTVNGLTSPLDGKENLARIFRFLNMDIDIDSGSRFPLSTTRKKNVFPSQDIINSTKLEFLNNFIGMKAKTKVRVGFEDSNYQSVCKSKNKTTLICLGPLTNIAKAIAKYKVQFTRKIDKIIIMGGAVYVAGNVGPKKLAEYNFYLDPEAADIVLNSGIKVLLVSMDATKYVPATEIIKNKIANKKTKSKYEKLIQKVIVSNQKDFRYFYDPLVASILVDKKIVTKTKKLGIKVDENGQSIPMSKGSVELVTMINSKKFYDLLIGNLK